MGDKFLSLEADKQRVFSMGVERFETSSGERPVVVTAERGRIAVFCGKADGSWINFLRPHDLLSRLPRRPEHSHFFGWSREIGVASGAGRIVLAYRRQFTSGDDPQVTTDRRELWIDIIAFDEGTEQLTGSTPVAVPRLALDPAIDGFGLCVWANRLDDRLLIVAQAFFAKALSEPALVLLTAPFPQDDGAILASAANWTVTRLDAGGWDFDVRREGNRLFVVHRRTAATYATDVPLPLDPFYGLPPIVLSEDPRQTGESLSAMAAGRLALVEASLPDGRVVNIDDGLPFGELPRIHRTNPFVITIERMRAGRIDYRMWAQSVSEATLHTPAWKTFLVMRTRLGWRAAPILAFADHWPAHLTEIAEAHFLFSLRSVLERRPIVRLEMAALFSINPVSLFGFEEQEKGTLVTFAHRDPTFASLRATTFRVFPDDGGATLVARPETYSTLDIGHREIRSADGSFLEYERFEPLALQRERDHEDDYPVFRREPQTGNMLAWGLAAAVQQPQTFYAFADMGDGGARVIYDQKLVLPPPAGRNDDKAFAIDTVAEPAQTGTAWVGLRASSFVNTDLSGYLVTPLPPRSLASNLERMLDLLPLLATVTGAIPSVPRSGETDQLPGNIETVILRRDVVDVVEADLVAGNLADNIPPLDPVRSRRGQPFQIEFSIGPALLFAGRAITFEARAIDFPPDAALTYDWAFSDGTNDTGRVIEHTFAAATLSDFSAATPAEATDPVNVTLTVTAADGRNSTATTTFDLPASLWATLWDGFAAFRRQPLTLSDFLDGGEIPGQGFFATGTTILDLLKYSIEYTTADTGEGEGMRVTYRAAHTGRFRFVEPIVPGQGDIEYELPIHFSLSGVQSTGLIGAVLGEYFEVDDVAGTLLYSQRFQACVQTSERRDGRTVSETVVERGDETPVMAPSALCCVPVGETRLELAEDFTVAARLTDKAIGSVMLIAALMGGAFAALVFAMLLPYVIATAPALLIPLIISGGLSTVVAALIAAGLAWLVALVLEHFLLKPEITSRIRAALERPEVKESLDESGVLTFAGEGLAEALAVQFIQQAQADGHGVADPRFGGRDRFRPQFFETIAVEAGQCKAKIRVSG